MAEKDLYNPYLESIIWKNTAMYFMNFISIALHCWSRLKKNKFKNKYKMCNTKINTEVLRIL